MSQFVLTLGSLPCFVYFYTNVGTYKQLWDGQSTSPLYFIKG